MGRLHSQEMLSQEDLVGHLTSHGWLEAEHCVNAMTRVDRRDFVQQELPLRLIYQVKRPAYTPTCQIIYILHLVSC